MKYSNKGEVIGLNRKLFAERLTQLRKEKGLLGKELATMLKMSYGTYSTWESGHRIPRLDKFLKLAQILEVNAHYLAGESDEKKPFSPQKSHTVELLPEDSPRLISNFSDQNEYGEWLKHPRELRQLAMDLLDRARQAKQEKEK